MLRFNGNKKINAIAYENEDLKPFIQSEANILAGELDRTMPGSRGATQVRNGNTVESIPYSQSKVSSEGIEAIQSATGASYEKIKKALNAIQEDHGKENNVLSKKIELIIDNRLTNGYADDVMGMDIPPHPDYILAKENIKEGLPNTHLNIPQKDKFKVMPSNIEKEMPQIDIDIPKSEIALSNDLPGESKFKTNTWRNAEFMQDPATQKVIDDINAVYEVKPNQQSFEIANTELNKDFDGFVNRIKTNGIKTAEDSVGAGIVTNKLLSQAKENGDYSQVKDWLQTVRPQVTDIAQSLQALSTWKQLTPEGTLLKAQRVVDSATEEIKKSNPRMFNDVMEKVNANPDMANDILKKAGIPQLTNDDVAFITNQMDKIEGMENGRAKDIEFAKVKQLIADKVPSTFKDKALAYQRISLLLNPKTMTRNVLGNVVMGGLENIKDIPATLIDKAIGSRTGSRTTTLPSLPTQLKGLGKGFKEAMEDFKLGVDTSPSSGQFDLPQSQAFRKGIMGKLEKATSFGLTLGDRPFWQGAYDESLRQQMKLNKVSVASEEMKQKAKEFAEDRTFQNVSGLVDGFKSLQKGLNFGKNVGLGNIVLPFTKTPANILDKAIDYSPIGGIKGATNLVMGLKNGTLDQKKVVDQLSRGLTGSTLIAMGYQMAKSGLLTGKSDKDKDVAALEKQAGKSEYAWKLGDTYRTVDWMQPAAIPLMIGADIFHQGKDSKHLNNTIVEAVMSGGDTLFKQSLLQGVQKFFGGSSNSAGFMDNLADAGLNAATQMVPSGLKQVNQLMDKKARDTSGDGKVESTINQMKSRIPGLAQTLPAKVDTMGKEINQFQGKNNPFNVLFNPGYTTKFDPSPGEKLALNIYENGGGKEFFPRVVDKKIEVSNKGKKETFNLTPAQKQEYQKLLGENTAMEFDKLGRDSNFSKMSTESQSEKLEKILSKVSKSSKEEMIRRLKNNR